MISSMARLWWADETMRTLTGPTGRPRSVNRPSASVSAVASAASTLAATTGDRVPRSMTRPMSETGFSVGGGGGGARLSTKS